MEEIVYQQEMVRVKAPALVNYVGIHMVGPTLMQIGTDEQKAKYIQKFSQERKYGVKDIPNRMLDPIYPPFKQAP